jgi:hypothetical protein
LNIRDLLATRGPCTGAELLDMMARSETGHSVGTGHGVEWGIFSLWKACRTQPGVVMQRVGRRYLRFDKRVEGYARLSPSIRRELLIYIVIGLTGQMDQIAERRLELQQRFIRISQYKREFARDFVRRIVESSPNQERLRAHVCCLLAGDVTYGMANAIERPEVSTRRLVRGSDLDVIVILDEEATAAEREALDEAIYREKWNMLVLPQFREEIDYVVKDMAKVLTQLQFDNLRHMIACKIMRESEFLYGSEDLFARIKRLVREFDIPQKLARMEEKATREREIAERELVEYPAGEQARTWLKLFFTGGGQEEIC